MFSTVIEDFSEYADLQAASEAAYAVVLGIIEDVLARPGAPDLPVSEAGGVCWAAVHGVSSLLLFGRDRVQDRGDRSPLTSITLIERDPAAVLRRLLEGLID